MPEQDYFENNLWALRQRAEALREDAEVLDAQARQLRETALFLEDKERMLRKYRAQKGTEGGERVYNRGETAESGFAIGNGTKPRDGL